jgi:hypothetical protein
MGEEQKLEFFTNHLIYFVFEFYDIIKLGSVESSGVLNGC